MQQSNQLVETLDRLISALSTSGQGYWRKYIANCRDEIAIGHDSGIEQLLGAYGGMGSLNDLVGSTVELDRALRNLVAESYNLAKALQQSQSAGGT